MDRRRLGIACAVVALALAVCAGAALNARLASDIAVRHAEAVDEHFNARYSARARLYAYRIRQKLPRGAYQRQYAWGLRDTLDVAAMQAAADRLAGSHDFRAVGRSPRPGGHTVRHVHEITVSGAGDWVTIAVAADAFLYGMVRRIAGALVDVGRRRRPLRRTPAYRLVPCSSQASPRRRRSPLTSVRRRST